MMFINFVVVLALIGLVSTSAGPNAAYVCSFCSIGLGLVEQAGLQVQLESYLKAQCDGSKVCEASVTELIKSMEAKLAPDTICKEANLCPDECTLYTKWPVDLPPQPISWPVERKLSGGRRFAALQDIFTKLASVVPSKFDENMPMMAYTSAAVASLMSQLKKVDVEYDQCGFNIKCKIDQLANHMPLQDADTDRFSTLQAKKLRGSDWRGYDCDDKHNDVYPGRAVNNYDSSVDHDCNGIVGSNSTGSYEDIFCKDYPGRSLIMLGDSATAHFHIPPQWITAQGWNVDGFLPIAEDELDFPMCSWGTGHATPEECPYQYPIPGINGVYSLYKQMRQRNRCNNNDFQNIGVNGARMTSSSQLIDAMARDPKVDKPALVWLSLIGNDVCNGHPGFDHMTKPDDFYTKTMESLNRLDALLPPGSTVVSLALFEGELLYDTMHNHQHPVGASYRDVYEFMNCLEENPCWGWLNANATNRQLTTQRSDQLNNVYRNISHTATFKNFNYIFYSPVWSTIFSDYAKAGYPLTNLIEPSDGFHPSQTGNAVLAQAFWKFMESEHPEALGPVNPHNDEIDALFFNKQR